ncbi:MAG: cytochrome c biogenesis protein CcsA [Bacteroidetes bacterium]|nr:cytochrome c biogenesis protein CcsA [Bacteroidota bacterium]
MKEIIYILPVLCIAYIIVNICFQKNNNVKNFSITTKLYYTIFATIFCLQTLNIYNFWSDNFAIYSVYSHSEVNLSVIYKISAGFSGMEGSFLLWLTCIGTIGMFFNKHIKNIFTNSKHIFICSNIFIAFPLFLSVALIFNNPFNLTPTGIDISDGLGLKPTLQSYYNLLHPPLIFIGFSILYLPYVISFTTLLARADINKKITKAITFWNKLGILCLSGGIISGSLWAYNTLGWGGFWGWDPIENAALIPLLLSFVLLHIGIISRKVSSENSFLKTFFLLSILIFPTIILCTFLVRSGLLIDSSVHSYIASRNNVAIYILCFLSLILIISLFLFAIRIRFVNTFQYIKTNNNVIKQRLITDYNKETSKQTRYENVIKHNVNIFGIIIILCITFMVLCGTLMPIIANNSIQIDSNFYMLWGMPLAAILLLLLGCSAVLKEKITKEKHPFFTSLKAIIIPFSIAIINTTILFFEGANTIIELLFFYACIFAITGKLQSLITKIAITKKIKLNYFSSFLSHTGIAILLVGAVLYGLFSEEEIILLEKNKLLKTKSNLHCTIAKIDIKTDKKHTYILPIIDVKYSKNNYILQPKIVISSSNNNFYMLPAILSFGFTDIYIEPLNAPAKDGLLFAISIKPYIKLVWIGFALLFCGLLISIFPSVIRR